MKSTSGAHISIKATICLHSSFGVCTRPHCTLLSASTCDRLLSASVLSASTLAPAQPCSQLPVYHCCVARASRACAPIRVLFASASSTQASTLSSSALLRPATHFLRAMMHVRAVLHLRAPPHYTLPRAVPHSRLTIRVLSCFSFLTTLLRLLHSLRSASLHTLLVGLAPPRYTLPACHDARPCCPTPSRCAPPVVYHC